MRASILFFFVFSTVCSKAQHFQLKNYGAGYRMFEINSVGNSPLTIAPFLKDPLPYQAYINSIQYNGLYGNPGIEILRNYYLTAEWDKNSPESRFWKKHTIQLELLVSNRLRKDNMALLNERFVVSPNDTTLFRDTYSLVQKQQFFGAGIGLNRRIKISNKLQFLTGLHLQGSLALVHHYHQQWDSSSYHHQTRTTKTTILTDLKGKNFFQWQAMIPLGIEISVYKKTIFLRAELEAGIVGSRYRKSNFSKKEAHGVGLWVIYQLRH
jgi:hypothetical protein